MDLQFVRTPLRIVFQKDFLAGHELFFTKIIVYAHNKRKICTKLTFYKVYPGQVI